MAKTLNLGKIAPAITNAGKAISQTTNQAVQAYNSVAGMGASAANAVSQAAQNNQFAYNSAEAAAQRDYNKQMWEAQSAYNSAQAEMQRAYQEDMWNKQAEYNSAEAEKARQFNAQEAALNREFQSAEAEKTRAWQENLSNTAYQRAMTDLKKAGLNPILAYMNGGAAIGSGATASGSAASAGAASAGLQGGASASAGLQSGANANGNNYTGQSYNMSESLAVMGMIGSMIGEGMSALGTWLQDQRNTETVRNTVTDIVTDMVSSQNNIFNGVMNVATGGGWNNIEKSLSAKYNYRSQHSAAHRGNRY